MKIFIENITQLDCAILAEHGPLGKSWNVDVVWEGERDAFGFLVDFSLAKKTAKNIIDSEFDHKLLVKPLQILFESNSQIIATQSLFAINTFKNGIKKISQQILTDLENDDISSLENEIAHTIFKNSPDNIKSVTVKLREQINQLAPERHFHYTHSLCFHQGNCQRFHGHQSCVEIYKDGKIDHLKSVTVASRLNNLYITSENFINKKWDSFFIQEILNHCSEISENKNELTAIEYQGTQGDVAIILPQNKVTTLPCESTIENLAYSIRNDFFKDEEKIEVRIYEGISKGAIS